METIKSIAGQLCAAHEKRKTMQRILDLPPLDPKSVTVELSLEPYDAMLAFARLGYSYMMDVTDDNPLECENTPEDPIDTAKRGYEFL